MEYKELLKSIEHQIEEHFKGMLELEKYVPKIEIDLLQAVKKTVYKERE